MNKKDIYGLGTYHLGENIMSIVESVGETLDDLRRPFSFPLKTELAWVKKRTCARIGKSKGRNLNVNVSAQN